MTESVGPGNNSRKYASGVNKNARLVVRNVPWQATEEALRQHFEAHGQVEEIMLLRRPDGKLVGCAFVHFKQVPMANKALVNTNKKQFMGRPLHVGWAVPKNKYEEKINLADKTDKNMSNIKNKASAPSDDGTVEVKEEIDDSSTPDANTKKGVRLNRNARLIIRNVSFKATEETLREHFASYGELNEVKLLKKPDGKLVGCAFVGFKNVPMAKKALLNTNMKQFLGRPVSVDWAVAKNKYMQHIDQQRLDIQENVKKEEESDSDGEDSKPNVRTALKAEVKSESEDSDDDRKSAGSNDDEDDDISEDDEDIPDDESQTSTVAEKKRIQLNDAEDGRTVFVTNVAFSVDKDRLRAFAEKIAPIEYALVCVDHMTEHSRGTGFIKFKNADDASRFLSLTPDELKLDGQSMQPRSALTRDHVRGDTKKQAKDSRNLYLVKEGVIVAGTRAAVGVSASDMAKRLALERSKTQMLKNLNRFVSRYRLVVSNLPPACDDARLRRLCGDAAGKAATITECRVMRDLRAPLQSNGKHPSKGFGFVMFMKTEDALTCLRKMNNNPDIFDNNNRPIVSFSIEDRTALNARKKRLEKSIANNPLSQKTEDSGNSRKRKNRESPDEITTKKGRFEKGKGAHKGRQNDNGLQNGAVHPNGLRKNPGNASVLNKGIQKPGQFVKKPLDDDIPDYTGLTSREGVQQMRSNHKLRAQADIHKQNVKLEKKQSKRALKLIMAAKERIKQPKMKINKNPKGNKSKKSSQTKPVRATKKDTRNFSDLVNKYKSKLVAGNKMDKVKAKWYE